MSDQKMLQGLFIYCKDIEEWPFRWRESDEDLDCGQKILEQMIPFAASLIEKKLARSTIRKYLDNLFLLGGEIIRKVNFEESQRKWPAKKLILEYIDECGGPCPNHWSRSNFTESRYINQYDSVCRLFYKHLVAREQRVSDYGLDLRCGRQVEVTTQTVRRVQGDNPGWGSPLETASKLS